jgi:hypothetical protein
MSQELMYTSAPRGLKPGSRGFCTVVSTQGISAKLVERLEALSGYRQIYPPNDPNESLNPVVYSHLKLTVDGRLCHVLSRICAAGLDYTQRANKFAHHVVLEENELPSAGPAWLLAQPNFMARGWDGRAQILPTSRRPPQGNVEPAICRFWKELTGDAGWGGVLAENAMSGNRLGTTIVFGPGMKLLPLIAESLSLLPPALRWQVTFSTYFTKLPPGVECRWRFVFNGSPEAASRPQGTATFDLCSAIGPPAGGIWVDAARSGRTGAILHRPASEGLTVAPEELNAEDVELCRLLADDGRQIDVKPPGGQTGNAASTLFGIGVIPPPVPTTSSFADNSVAAAKIHERFGRKPRSILPLMFVAAATLLISIMGVVAYITVRNAPKEVAVNAQPNLNTADKGKSEVDRSNDDGREKGNNKQNSVSKTHEQSSKDGNGGLQVSPPTIQLTVPPNNEHQADEQGTQPATGPTHTNVGSPMPETAPHTEQLPIAQPPKPSEPDDPLKDFKSLKSFPLKRYDTTSAEPFNQQTICAIGPGLSERASIDLKGLEILLPPAKGMKCILVRDSSVSAGWNVLVTSPQIDKPRTIGTLSIENGALLFQWKKQEGISGEKVNQIRNALLFIDRKSVV